jgi:hypothetical protein
MSSSVRASENSFQPMQASPLSKNTEVTQINRFQEIFKSQGFNPKVTFDVFQRVQDFYETKGLKCGLEEAEMMSRGADILDNINGINSRHHADLPNQEPDAKAKEDLRNLMWYVEADSFAHCGGGAISAMHCCPDSERKFYDYLEKTAEATGESYARPSSHYSKRIERIDGKKATQMGIDIDGLPGGKSTILFGKLKKGVTFFKMELHGCAPFFLKSCFRTWKNFFNFCGHALDLIRDIGQKLGAIAPTEGARIEKMGHGVVNEATKFINASYENKIRRIHFSFEDKLENIIDGKGLLYKDPETLRRRPIGAGAIVQAYDKKQLVDRLKNSGEYNQEINKSIEAEKQKAAESRKQDLEEINNGSRNLANTVKKVVGENGAVPLHDFPKLKAAVKAFDSRNEEDNKNRVTEVQRDGNEYIHNFITSEWINSKIPLGAITA